MIEQTRKLSFVGFLVALIAFVAPTSHGTAKAASPKRANGAYELHEYLLPGVPVEPGSTRRLVGFGFGYRALNASGSLVCEATFFAPDDPSEAGLYVYDGAEFVPLLRASFNDNLTLSSRPVQNDSGGVTFRYVDVSDPSNRRFAIAIFRNGELVYSLRAGDEIEPGRVVRELSPEPVINAAGDVAFMLYTQGNDQDDFSIYKYSGGALRRMLGQGDEAPGGGRFSLNYGPLPRVWLADNGDMLFKAGVLGGPDGFNAGLFVLRHDGTVDKLEMSGDPLPIGGRVSELTLGNGTLNGVGEAVFRVRIKDGPADSGIFLNADGMLVPVMRQGQKSPLGGPYLSLYHPTPHDPGGDGAAEHDPPVVNASRQVLFKSEARDRNGKAKYALFLASEHAAVKVAAVGDRLPDGRKIEKLHEYSLDESGRVALRVFARFPTRHRNAYGVFLAVPKAPVISKATLKRKGQTLRLVIKGSGFIVGDAIVAINGETFENVAYSEQQAQGDGTTRSLSVIDERLEHLLASGDPLTVTVYNPLTNQASDAVEVR